MACGTPVMASDVEALREVGGDAARFVPPGDAAAFARAIASSSPGRARVTSGRVAPEGFLRARQFSWTHTAEALWQRARESGPGRVRWRPV